MLLWKLCRRARRSSITSSTSSQLVLKNKGVKLSGPGAVSTFMTARMDLSSSMVKGGCSRTSAWLLVNVVPLRKTSRCCMVPQSSVCPKAGHRRSEDWPWYGLVIDNITSLGLQSSNLISSPLHISHGVVKLCMSSPRTHALSWKRSKLLRSTIAEVRITP